MTLQEQLIELRQLDQRVRGLSGRLQTTTRRLETQQAKLELLKRQQTELQDQLKTYQAHAATLEKQAGDAEARIDKLREQMNNVTSNKEYSALLLEVNTLKVDKSKVEDEALEQMTQVDQYTEQLTAATQKLADQQKMIAGAEQDVTDARAEIGTTLEAATGERDTAAEKVSAEVLSMFNLLADQYDGEAVVAIEEQDRRRMEYTCVGCYMNLPVERVNTLIVRPDELVICPNCNRILYIDTELKQAIGAK